MTRTRAFFAVTIAAMGLGLSGCVTLLPKSEPAQLYRFGGQTTAQAPVVTASQFNVLRFPTSFTAPAEGDRILTTTGQQTAYVAGARWVAPASVLFDEATVQAFEAAGGPARLTRRGDIGSSRVSLRLDVQTFEARYAGGSGAAPTVIVRVRALLSGPADTATVSERTFEARKPASDNRVGPIVVAFDAATTEVLGQIVAWTATQGATVSPSP